VLGRLDRLIFRKEVIESARVIKDAEEKGEGHRLVDLFNEDLYLTNRLKHYQKQDDD